MRHLLVLIFIISFKHSYCQTNNNSLHLNIGPIYRITPFYLSDATTTGTIFPIYLEEHRQLTGAGLYIGATYLLSKSLWSFSLGHSFRYDHVYYEQVNPDEFNYKEIQRVIIDQHFGVSKSFRIKRNLVSVGLEYSPMNRNTTYNVTEVAFNNVGDTMFLSYAADFNFTTLGITLGYQVKQLRIELTNRFAERPEYPSNNSMILPELRFSYVLPLRMKKVY